MCSMSYRLLSPQIKYYTDAHQIYNDLSSMLAPVSPEQEEGSQGVQQKLAEIRALSITVDD